MKRTILYALCWFIPLIITAQPICQVKEFSINDGLSQDIISDLLQDQKNFIWVSTRNGISKFDGYTFKNYKSSPHHTHTLSNNRITDIAETKNGDIWCQTYDGRVYIFDTYHEIFIDVLAPIEEEIKQINLVQRIYSLGEGITWIVCDKGYCYRVEENRYQEKEGVVLYSTYNHSLKGNTIFKIFRDSEGDEWVLTEGGISIIGNKKIDSDFPFKQIREYQNRIYLISTSGQLACYDPTSGNINFIQLPAEVKEIDYFTPLSHHILALGGSQGVTFFDVEQKSFHTLNIFTNANPSNRIVSVYEDREGDIWIYSTQPGIIHYNPKTGERQHLYTPKEELVTYERKSNPLIFEDIQGTLWMIPNEGSFSYYDRAEKNLKPYYTDPHDLQTRFAPLARNFFMDRQGNAWIVGARGVNKMSFYPQTYSLHHLDDGFETRALLKDRSQRIWVACKSGYVRIFNESGDLQGYLSSQGIISKTKTPFGASVYCFKEDANGNIWAGTKNDGLYQLIRENDHRFKIVNYSHREEDLYSLSSNDIYSILIDSRENLWIGTYGGGINLLRTTTDGKPQFINSRNQLRNYPIGISHNVRHLAEGEDGVILVGTTCGLITFSNRFSQPEEIKFYRNKPHSGSSKGLSGSDIMHIYMDSSREIYIATFTGGINKAISENLLSENIEFSYYTIREGLGSELVLSIQEDCNGELWITSENSLARFNKDTQVFENYDTNFLRQKLNFTEAIPVVNNCQLLFGTDLGLLVIAPEQVKKSQFIPSIEFTDLIINGNPAPIGNMKQIELQPSERNISITFAALDYVRPEDISYAYRLEGLEKDWNYSHQNRTATYINLPAGEYQLHIKSTNSDGVWVDNTRTLTIRVKPTFHETAWAWLVYTIFLLLFVLSIVYVLFYIYRLRHKIDMEQQLSNIKLRFFTDISHELRTPLTLISTPVSEVLENEPLSPVAKEHLTVVHKNTERMLRLVNQILDFRKIQNKKMKVLAERTELIAFLTKITENFRLIAEEKKINFSFEADQEELFLWIDRDKVEKIIFNLLSNAFKYTLPRKSIKLHVKSAGKSVQIFVEDEGIGIAREKQETLFQRFETLSGSNILHPSSGIGLSLVKELVEMHHGTIGVTSHPGIGSKFCVTLPIHKETFEKDEQVEFLLADASASNEQETSAPVVTTTTEQELSDEEGNLTILIVEDNAELKKLLKTILSASYTIIEASNGKEGIEKAIELIPDMIISDVMMPVMDGIEMVKSLKGNKDTCHIPIILLTSKSSLDDRIEGIEQGIDDYITKPFSSSYLKARIVSLFNQRKVLQEAFLNKLGEEKKSSYTQWEPAQPEVQHYDELFMQQVMEYMEKQMDNSDLTIDDFANELSLSRTIFYRKLKSIVGLTPVDFIREMRLKRATQLIENSSYNFSQIAYMTGFSDPKYFSKCFKRRSGVSPREYKEQIEKEEAPNA